MFVKLTNSRGEPLRLKYEDVSSYYLTDSDGENKQVYITLSNCDTYWVKESLKEMDVIFCTVRDRTGQKIKT